MSNKMYFKRTLKHFYLSREITIGKWDTRERKAIQTDRQILGLRERGWTRLIIRKGKQEKIR